MSLATQKQLAKSNITRNMQDGGRCEVMQLEAIVLQKPSEEQMDWKSDTPQQVGDKAYSPPGWVGKLLRLLPTVEGSQSGSNMD